MGAVALGLVVAACGGQGSHQATPAGGAVLDPPLEPLPFSLVDQFGHRLSLEALRGRPVALTFLYTRCPDLCPLTAAKLRHVYDLLGRDAGQVRFVAISVDPARDTPQDALEFSQRHDMLNRWSFLTGPREELEPLWQLYGVRTLRQHVLEAAHEHGEATAEGYLLDHAAPVYILDGDGLVRVAYGSAWDPEAVARDLAQFVED